MDISINYLAVLVAAIAAFAVGAVWYSYLFQKPWMALMGFSPERMRSMPLSATQAMAVGFVVTLLSTYVLAVFVSAAPDLTGALILTFWIWLGFVATVQIGSFLWEGRPIKLFFINASQTLVAMLVAALILTLWR